MERAASSVVGVVLLLGITVVGAATVGLAVNSTTETAPTMASFDLAVDAETNSLTLTHRGGDPVDLTQAEFHVTVDGVPLESDPPIPFFAAVGFRSGPDGPFNAASPNTWHSGETGRFRIAGTNDPTIAPGSAVTVRVVVDGTEIAKVTATA
ncbi:type IV pilin [Halovenus sp. WSH3]|uniref:Type IV pilin n=1 Tax=Halovenus carboxidivorans TaxID=2692199 RepID=A0A6B0TDF7_9EURY|nr:type IV pilin N-terminal domain-containing protein [Halovenus carboxidivorans]MXR51229.1 type IV pilin [Halovenus carboxidivorans]